MTETKSAVEALTAQDRQAVALRLEGKSYEQIAKAVNLKSAEDALTAVYVGATDEENDRIYALDNQQTRTAPKPQTTRKTSPTTRKAPIMQNIKNEAAALYKKLADSTESYARELPKLEQNYKGDELTKRADQLKAPFGTLADEIDGWMRERGDKLASVLAESKSDQPYSNPTEGVYAELRAARYWEILRTMIDAADTPGARLTSLPKIVDAIPEDAFSILAGQVQAYTAARGWDTGNLGQQLDQRRAAIDPDYARVVERQGEFERAEYLLKSHASAARSIARSLGSSLDSSAVSTIRTFPVQA